MDKEKILAEIKEQIKLGLDFMGTKREIFRNRLVKYLDQNKDDDVIGVNTLYASVNLDIAIKYSDELSVVIMPRKFGDEEYADNLTDLAKYDYDEMQLKRINFQRYWDEDIFGYSIVTKKGRDEKKKVVKIQYRDPLTRIPDPFSDHLTPGRWHFFEQEILLDEMKEFKGYREDEVQNYMLSELQRNRSERNRVTGQSDVEDNTLNRVVSCYEGYTTFEEKLYMVTVDVNCQHLLRFEEVKPVLEGEEADDIDMRTLVNVNRYNPIFGNPCGSSLADLVIDKQSANKQLLNLQLIDAKFGVFGQTNLVNTKIIKNTAELTKPSINTKWVGVNAEGESLANAIYPVPRQSISADSFNVAQELSRQIQLDTGMDSRTLGVQGDKSITLGESQQIQANANVRFGLSVEISNWGMIDFWKYMWFRSYQEFFSESDTKFIRVSTGFGTNLVEFRRDDFLGTEDIDITIESKKKVDAMREGLKASFLAKLPMILQDPTTPKITKSLAMRFALKLDGVSREMQYLLVPPSVEELGAKEKLKLIDANLMEGATINNIDEDHMTYIVVFQGARDTEAKREAIKRREKAIVQSGQNQQQPNETVNAAANVATSQLTAGAMQQNKGTQSLQNIT